MVRHVIVWTLKEDVWDREAAKAEIKEGLEGLVGKVDGLVELKVETEPLPGCGGDMMLDALFSSEEALKGYSSDPRHLAVAEGKVRPRVASRACFDFEVG